MARPATAGEVAGLRAQLRGLRSPRWYSSPARRCRALAAVLEDAVACLDPDLLEFDFGDWEGRHWDDVPRNALDHWAADPRNFAAPGGEATPHFIRRVARFAGALRRDGRDAVVVTHGGPLRLLPALLRGEAPNLLVAAPPCGSLSVVQAEV